MTTPLEIIQSEPIKTTLKETVAPSLDYGKGIILNVSVQPSLHSRIGYRLNGKVYYLDQGDGIFVTGSIASLLMINPSFLARLSSGEITIISSNLTDDDDSEGDASPDME